MGITSPNLGLIPCRCGVGGYCSYYVGTYGKSVIGLGDIILVTSRPAEASFILGDVMAYYDEIKRCLYKLRGCHSKIRGYKLRGIIVKTTA